MKMGSVLEVKRCYFNTKEFEDVVKIRMEVFVKEQGVPKDMELDEYEDVCEHYLCISSKSNEHVGAFRLNIKDPYIKLERVAVLKKSRGNGFGAFITKWVVNYCRENYPKLVLAAHAQSSVLPFYGYLGAVVVSEEFLDEVNILHRTIIFPDAKNSHEYSILSYDENSSKCTFNGECSDPTVIRNIKHLLCDISNSSKITLDTLTELLNSLIIGEGYTQKFTRYAVYVIEQQTSDNPMFKGLFQPTYTWDQLIEDEKFLLNMAWKHLNIGHYSTVDESWRYFYFAVSFAKCLRLRNEGNFQSALNALDMGLLMGRHRFYDNFIIQFVESLSKSLEITKISKNVSANIEKPICLSHSESIPIEMNEMSEEAFFEKYGLKEIPVVIRGLAKNWLACSQWSMEFLNQTMGQRLVPVEVGSKYTEDGWSQKIMPASQFFSKCNETVAGSHEEGIHYLAQHRLLDQVPELKTYLGLPSYCSVTGSTPEDIERNLWIGPQGTVSPLHTDPRHNIFCQIFGKKFVRLISPQETEYVYPMKEGILTNTSEVNVENPDYKKFPLFAKARCFDAILEPGDGLFIPKKWWHFVKSLSPSISTSYWFDMDLD